MAQCNDGGEPSPPPPGPPSRCKLRHGRFHVAGSFTSPAADGVTVAYRWPQRPGQGAHGEGELAHGRQRARHRQRHLALRHRSGELVDGPQAARGERPRGKSTAPARSVPASRASGLSLRAHHPQGQQAAPGVQERIGRRRGEHGGGGARGGAAGGGGGPAGGGGGGGSSAPGGERQRPGSATRSATASMGAQRKSFRCGTRVSSSSRPAAGTWSTHSWTTRGASPACTCRLERAHRRLRHPDDLGSSDARPGWRAALQHPARTGLTEANQTFDIGSESQGATRRLSTPTAPRKKHLRDPRGGRPGLGPGFAGGGPQGAGALARPPRRRRLGDRDITAFGRQQERDLRGREAVRQRQRAGLAERGRCRSR